MLHRQPHTAAEEGAELTQQLIVASSREKQIGYVQLMLQPLGGAEILEFLLLAVGGGDDFGNVRAPLLLSRHKPQNLVAGQEFHHMGGHQHLRALIVQTADCLLLLFDRDGVKGHLNRIGAVEIAHHIDQRRAKVKHTEKSLDALLVAVALILTVEVICDIYRLVSHFAEYGLDIVIGSEFLLHHIELHTICVAAVVLCVADRPHCRRMVGGENHTGDQRFVLIKKSWLFYHFFHLVHLFLIMLRPPSARI